MVELSCNQIVIAESVCVGVENLYILSTHHNLLHNTMWSSLKGGH